LASERRFPEGPSNPIHRLLNPVWDQVPADIDRHLDRYYATRGTKIRGREITARSTTIFFYSGRLPVDLGDKLQVAAALHGQSMRAYIQAVLDDHVRALEKSGVKLSVRARRSDSGS